MQAWMIPIGAALAGGLVVAAIAAIVCRVMRARLVAALTREADTLRDALGAADARADAAVAAQTEAAQAWARRETELEETLAREAAG
ncbi:chemotaxis protein, partial [Burkholderia sp. Tr-862]|nr:chemotaxis protein [Burkholderia sp. Tr-862]